MFSLRNPWLRSGTISDLRSGICPALGAFALRVFDWTTVLEQRTLDLVLLRNVGLFGHNNE